MTNPADFNRHCKKMITCVRIMSLVLLVSVFGIAKAQGDCPVTLGKHYDDSPFPEFLWYRDGNLGVTVSDDGLLYTVRPQSNLSAKLFWWSDDFRIGMEDQWSVTAEYISGSASPPIISSPTNAYSDELADTGPWSMLVGIVFQEPGCWRIIGEFLGDQLSYVVEVKNFAEHPQLSDQP